MQCHVSMKFDAAKLWQWQWILRVSSWLKGSSRQQWMSLSNEVINFDDSIVKTLLSQQQTCGVHEVEWLLES